MASGVPCPVCDKRANRVTNSRGTRDTVRRRRECLKCGARFTTIEVVVATTPEGAVGPGKEKTRL